ncbi:hypothetical protein B1759_18955 [Rubrivirga sp. SAORIC476]|uniref:hypothetical protein n=1 Tax=Rubrivirga sp. SAORIC476 TaxID=1961794 RepID=UPI000BA9B1F4|nr:hypothetical protein [Rubrivirga sp. SAORIC476]PAP74275.1 hypothetical protein B1759_18955 [Rubrivirga sp. SAORIC476]
MPIPTDIPPGSATCCLTAPQADTAPDPLPDLFGFVAPASPTKPSARSTPTATSTPAEWPAAGALRLPRPVPVFQAPDRPPASPSAPLAGLYVRTGANLRRADGRALVVCLSTKPPTARRPARYVRTVAPADPIRYAGSLYPARVPNPDDDLDGCQFQDEADRTRYALHLTGPDRYRVTVATRRGRSGR